MLSLKTMVFTIKYNNISLIKIILVPCTANHLRLQGQKWDEFKKCVDFTWNLAFKTDSLYQIRKGVDSLRNKFKEMIKEAEQIGNITYSKTVSPIRVLA